MADITMCTNKLCPLSGTCYRALAVPNQHWQSYASFYVKAGINGYECDEYITCEGRRIQASNNSGGNQ